jgi:hypothetical protein
VHRVTKGDFGELERRVKRFAQRHVQHVAGERQIGIRSVLTVSVDPLRVQNGLDLLEKRWIHATLC